MFVMPAVLPAVSDRGFAIYGRATSSCWSRVVSRFLVTSQLWWMKRKISGLPTRWTWIRIT